MQLQYVSRAAHMADGGRVGVYVAQVRQLMRLRQLPQPVKQLRSPAQLPGADLSFLLPSAGCSRLVNVSTSSAPLQPQQHDCMMLLRSAHVAPWPRDSDFSYKNVFPICDTCYN